MVVEQSGTNPVSSGTVPHPSAATAGRVLRPLRAPGGPEDATDLPPDHRQEDEDPMETVHVSADQAAAIYRELRDLDAARRRARRAPASSLPGGRRARGTDRSPARVTSGLAQEVSLQSALLLLQPYLSGGEMTDSLARLIVTLLDAEAPSAGTEAVDPAHAVTAAASRVVLRASLLAQLESAEAQRPVPRQRLDDVPRPRSSPDDHV